MISIQQLGRGSFRNFALGMTTIVAPLCLLLGWIILMQRSGKGPDQGWFISHTMLLLGAILFIPTVIGLRMLLSNPSSLWADISAISALIGLAALVGQFAIDLVIGIISSDQTDMSAFFRQISAAPGIAIPFHLVGPVAFYGGLLALIMLIMQQDTISRWNGMLTILGIIAVGAQAVTGNAQLALVGFTGMSVGLIATAWVIFQRDRSDEIAESVELEDF